MNSYMVVFFTRPDYFMHVAPLEEVMARGGELIWINDDDRDGKIKTWGLVHFGEMGQFALGNGPTNLDRERHKLYPRTQAVFDKMSEEEFQLAFTKKFGGGNQY